MFQMNVENKFVSTNRGNRKSFLIQYRYMNRHIQNSTSTTSAWRSNRCTKIPEWKSRAAVCWLEGVWRPQTTMTHVSVCESTPVIDQHVGGRWVTCNFDSILPSDNVVRKSRSGPRHHLTLQISLSSLLPSTCCWITMTSTLLIRRCQYLMN